MLDIIDTMFTIEQINRNITLGGTPLKIDFRYFRADLKNREVLMEFYRTVNFFLDGAPAEIHNYVTGMLMIYMTYRYPPSAPKKRTNLTYKRDIRKYDRHSLRNMYNPTFLELKSRKKLKYEEIESKLFKEINKEDSRTFSRELWNKALYFAYPFNHSLNEDEFDDYKQKQIRKYFDWQESTVDSKKKKTDFRDLFQDEQPEFHALLYEAEIIFNLFWETFFIKILEDLEVKYELTEIERKVYLLTYTRQELFNNCIPAFEEIITSFINYLNDKDLTALILAVFYDISSLNGYVLNKFTEFVKFYPIWLAMLQLDESLNDNEKFIILNKSNQFFFSGHKDVKKYIKVEGEDDINQTGKRYVSEVSLDDIVKGSENLTYNELFSINDTIGSFYGNDTEKALYLKFDLEALKIFFKELPVKQKEVIKAVYLEEKNQVDLEKELGISQSAISQRINTALQNMRKRFDE